MDLPSIKIFVCQQVQPVELDSSKMLIEDVNHALLSVQLASVPLPAVNAPLDSLSMVSTVLLLLLNFIPNGLSPLQRSNFFLIVPSSGDKVSFVNQWQPDSTTVMVAINYAQFPLKSTAYLAINARQLASSYASIGYTADSNSFVSASISTNNANCPSSLVVPASTSAV